MKSIRKQNCILAIVMFALMSILISINISKPVFDRTSYISSYEYPRARRLAKTAPIELPAQPVRLILFSKSALYAPQ